MNGRLIPNADEWCIHCLHGEPQWCNSYTVGCQQYYAKPARVGMIAGSQSPNPTVAEAFAISKPDATTQTPHEQWLLTIIEILESHNAALRSKIAYLEAKINQAAK